MLATYLRSKIKSKTVQFNVNVNKLNNAKKVDIKIIVKSFAK